MIFILSLAQCKYQIETVGCFKDDPHDRLFDTEVMYYRIIHNAQMWFHFKMINDIEKLSITFRVIFYSQILKYAGQVPLADIIIMWFQENYESNCVSQVPILENFSQNR